MATLSITIPGGGNYASQTVAVPDNHTITQVICSMETPPSDVIVDLVEVTNGYLDEQNVRQVSAYQGLMPAARNVVDLVDPNNYINPFGPTQMAIVNIRGLNNTEEEVTISLRVDTVPYVEE